MEEEAPAGAPEWVVTYGDMMSLLLTFFIMLVSLSEVKATEKYRAILEAIQHRLGGYRNAPLAPPGKSFPLNAMIEKLKTLGSQTNVEKGRGGVRARGPEGLECRVYRRRDGLAINVGGQFAFERGKSELSPQVKQAITEVATVLAGKPNKVEVRGHTSSRALPADSEFADKYVLSFRRAREVLELLESLGIAHQRLRATAAADMLPLPDSGDKDTLQEDRVEILVADTFSSEFSGERDIPD